MTSYDGELGKQLRSVVSDVDRLSCQENLESSEDRSNERSTHKLTCQAIVHSSPVSSTHENNSLVRSRRTESNGNEITNQQPIKASRGSSTPCPCPERSPLIRPRMKGDISSDDGLHVKHNIISLPRTYGACQEGKPRKKTQQPSPETPLKPLYRLVEYITSTLLMRSTSVMVFMVLLVLGIVLTTAANLKLDKKGLQIEPHHVLVYIMCLMAVFIFWVTSCIFPQNLKSSFPCNGALIPSHLLTGIGIFGTVAAMAEMLSFVDFIKCSRHVNNLNVMYGIYPFVKSLFMYCQIYFFYKLSKDGIHTCKVPGGNFFLMVTLATNMCIWWATFLNDASNDPKLKSVTWLNHYHFGVNGYDACGNSSVTSLQAKQLHGMLSELQPYVVTCSMEYVLLASGLLLHVWQNIKYSNTLNSQILAQQHWTLWRVGFIVGLLSIPSVVVAYIHQNHVKKVGTAKVVLCCFLGTICTVLLISSWYCIKLLQRYFVKINKPMKLEVIILGVSFIGFPIIDLCDCFAAVCEFQNLITSEVVWFGLSSFADLVAAGLQFLFIKAAYEHKLPDVAESKASTAAQRIRQFASFALVVNIAYWGAKTKELRRSPSDPNVAETFFGNYGYFGLSHLAYPLCIFFHFHIAICFANVISFHSQFGPLYYFVRSTEETA